MSFRLVAAFLLVSSAFAAESMTRPRRGKKAWWVSVAAVAAASALDIHSSWVRREINPMLRGPDGRFGGRGVVVKASILGASCGLQWLWQQHDFRMSDALGGMNVGLAAWSVGVSVRNRRN